MIKLKDLQMLAEDKGMTLLNGNIISYSNGYQVATEGKETTSARIALKMIKEYNGNCGVWYSKNVFYIDKSHHVEDRETAIAIGINHNQQSILDWSTMELIWL